MKEKPTVEFLLRVMKAVSDADSCDEIGWRCDGEYAPLTIWCTCSDVFYWATADAEDVTPENVAELEKAYLDCPQFGNMLFASRVRKLRPMGACYKMFPPEIAAMFDAAGPERADGDGKARKAYDPEW